MHFPLFMRHVNPMVTNLIMGSLASLVAPLAVMHHAGRRSGRAYRTRFPAAAVETPRQAIRRLLAAAPCTAHDLSALVRLPEKEIVPHLEHLARSLRGASERLEVEPAQCDDCGYVFRDRRRLARPSACPMCRSQRLSAPVFRIAGRP
jgi:predicted Zn-ribbon and HTH transcriptional regulator